MIGGLTGRPLENSTGPGTPIPMPQTSSRRCGPTSASSSLKTLVHPAEHLVGPDGDVQVGGSLDERRAVEVAEREPRVGRAEVGHEDDAGVAVEREHGRRAAAGRGAAAGLVDESEGEQRVDALRHGGAGEAGLPGEIGAGYGDAFADQSEQGARAGLGRLRGVGGFALMTGLSKPRVGRSAETFD